jgi:hypothetical protein
VAWSGGKKRQKGGIGDKWKFAAALPPLGPDGVHETAIGADIIFAASWSRAEFSAGLKQL